MSNMSSKDDEVSKDAKFISFLYNLVEKPNLGALVILRRGLGHPPGTIFEMYKYIVPWVSNEYPWNEKMYYLIAALFAWHRGIWPKDRNSENFGETLAKIKDPDNPESIEKRYTALLNCHEDDLYMHMQQLVGLLISKNIPIDWLTLLQNLINWRHPDCYIQKRWSRYFWKNPFFEQKNE